MLLQGDGGDPNSWPMIYNALWLSLLQLDNLIPNQQTIMDTQRDWYIANVMQEFGLPLNSRKLYTKVGIRVTRHEDSLDLNVTMFAG